jgi:hypothetical protein
MLSRVPFGVPANTSAKRKQLSFFSFFLFQNDFFMTHTTTNNHTAKLSKLMRVSWQIQHRRKFSRSKALLAAWAIFLNEDITVFLLVKKHSHERYANKVEPTSLSLFNR